MPLLFSLFQRFILQNPANPSTGLPFRTSSAEPMFAVIGLVQTADDDASAGTGMYETAVFQVETYVTGGTLFSSVVEEHQVAFLQSAFVHPLAILPVLAFGAAVQLLSVYLLVECGGQSRTVGAFAAVSASSVRGTHPAGSFYIQKVVVLEVNVHFQGDGGMRQLLVVDTRGAGTTTGQQEREKQEQQVGA